MGLIGVGVALVVLGILLSLSVFLGFVAGVPLAAIGVVLIAIGLVVAVVNPPYRWARRI